MSSQSQNRDLTFAPFKLLFCLEANWVSPPIKPFKVTLWMLTSSLTVAFKQVQQSPQQSTSADQSSNWSTMVNLCPTNMCVCVCLEQKRQTVWEQACLQCMTFYETGNHSMCDPHKEVWMGFKTPLPPFSYTHISTRTIVLSSHGDCVPVYGIFQAESGTEDTSQFVLKVCFDVSG